MVQLHPTAAVETPADLLSRLTPRRRINYGFFSSSVPLPRHLSVSPNLAEELPSARELETFWQLRQVWRVIIRRVMQADASIHARVRDRENYRFGETFKRDIACLVVFFII